MNPSEQRIATSVLVIGGGGSGLRAAHPGGRAWRRRPHSGKRPAIDVHTTLAAGGISAADTLKESYFLADPQTVQIVAKGAAHGIAELERWGMPFVGEADERISQRFFGAHTFRRTAFAGAWLRGGANSTTACAVINHNSRTDVRSPWTGGRCEPWLGAAAGAQGDRRPGCCGARRAAGTWRRVGALVRDPAGGSAQRLADRGVEVVPGLLDDEESLATSMDDTAGVFALTTPFEAGVEAEVEQGRAIIAAARRTRVPHLLFSSVAGANEHSGVPHFDSKAVIETELIAADVPYTILAPTYFFDNALGGADRIRAGVLDLSLPSDRPLQQLARPDLGAFAAEVLSSPDRYVARRTELASDAPTPARMAAALSDALRRPVRHEQVPLAAIDNPDMHAMWEFLTGRGYQVDIRTLQLIPS